MIGKTAITSYSTAASFSCYHCLNTTCQGIKVPAGNPFIFQNGVTYQSIQEQNVYSATDYFWRKYYSDLATGFSKPLTTYFKQYNAYEKRENVHNTVVQESNIITSSGESKEFFERNESIQIWRPFSPPAESQDFCFSNETNFHRRIETVPRRDHLSIVPSINKLDHSTSSVFVPVKKKSQFCAKCPAAFYNSVQLLAHMRVHAGTKPFVCPNCSKSFARNEELTRHRRIHSGYKPHHCVSCGKSFGRKDHLSKHLKTHLQVSEKKVYECHGCGHRYTRSDALTRHRNNAHADETCMK